MNNDIINLLSGGIARGITVFKIITDRYYKNQHTK